MTMQKLALQLHADDMIIIYKPELRKILVSWKNTHLINVKQWWQQ